MVKILACILLMNEDIVLSDAIWFDEISEYTQKR
jgi:hypothetical protein